MNLRGLIFAFHIFNLFTLVFFGTALLGGIGLNRRKRFFHNLNSYFSKSTVAETATESVKSSTSRNLKPVYVFDGANYLCANHGYGGGECNNSKNYSNLETGTATPVWYLVPPTNAYEEYSTQVKNEKEKIVQSYPQVLYNGYTYHNPSLKDDSATSVRISTINDNNFKNFFHYLPPLPYPSIDSELLKVTINEMSCARNSRNGRFTVVIETSRSISASPIIENGYNSENLPQCSVTTLNATTYQINIRDPDMINCGVYYCNTNTETNLMCLSLRFPVINGIKTSEDLLVRIQCSLQQRTMSQTKQIQLKSSPINVNIGRSLALEATINSEIHNNREINSQIGLYAQTSTGYTQFIRNNDAVALGENLQLRSIIKNGDGWQFSRFGKIIAKKALSPSYGYVYGDNMDSVVIVADDGCVNPLMKPVCPHEQFNDPDNALISLLNMRMFVFENMNDGDELILIVTVFGCIHHEDCVFGNSSCDRQVHSRWKRSKLSPANETIDTMSEFRLRITNTANRIEMRKNKIMNLWTEPIFVVLIFIIGFILFISTVYFLNHWSLFKYIHII